MQLLRLEAEVLGMIMSNDVIGVPIKPDPAMIAIYVDVIFGYCENWVPVRALPEKGAVDRPPHTPFMEADGKPRRAAEARGAGAMAVDAGMVAVRQRRMVQVRAVARAEHIKQTQVVMVDDRWHRHQEYLVRHLGTPTLEVASGGITAEGQRKLHLYWRLMEPAEADDITTVCRAPRKGADRSGGDGKVPIPAPFSEDALAATFTEGTPSVGVTSRPGGSG